MNDTTFEKLGWAQSGDHVVAGAEIVPPPIVHAVLGEMRHERDIRTAWMRGRADADMEWFKRVMHERTQWRSLLARVAEAIADVPDHDDVKEAIRGIIHEGRLPASIDDTRTAEVCDELIDGIVKANHRVNDLQAQMAKIEAGLGGPGDDDVYQLVRLLTVQNDPRAARRLLTGLVRQKRLNATVVERLLSENVLPSAAVSAHAPNAAELQETQVSRRPKVDGPVDLYIEEEILRRDQKILCSFCLGDAILQIRLVDRAKREIKTWGALCEEHRPRMRELRGRIRAQESTCIEARNDEPQPA